ncbi:MULTISPECIES: hypothetical protein [unclassified Shinella]|uniref:hypothetical protein n=1 Tax=unclassified Shinella TaxID=2643062 RepID=UPI0018D1AF6E|nr:MULTISPECIES: hypothetical protein [unclassified Shinella]
MKLFLIIYAGSQIGGASGRLSALNPHRHPRPAASGLTKEKTHERTRMQSKVQADAA